MLARRRVPRQGELPLKRWGGSRPGAGRKPTSRRALVPHRARAPVTRHTPVHVTLRLERRLGNLRRKWIARAMRPAFAGGRERFGFRLVHFSVQKDHVHLVAEAPSAQALGRGLKGFGVRLARRLNAALGHRGRVLADRYHARVLRTPREVRAAVVYVLQNARHHVRPGDGGVLWPDPYSSGRYFDGWRGGDCAQGGAAGPAPPDEAEDRPVVEPRCFLLAVAWRRLGLIRRDEAPRS